MQVADVIFSSGARRRVEKHSFRGYIAELVQ